jgi:hypothetical protein
LHELNINIQMLLGHTYIRCADCGIGQSDEARLSTFKGPLQILCNLKSAITRVAAGNRVAVALSATPH